MSERTVVVVRTGCDGGFVGEGISSDERFARVGAMVADWVKRRELEEGSEGDDEGGARG